jgi:CRISPR type III-B/RAMP module RAMP protein Cmr1
LEEFTVKIKALTPIWTGDAQGKNSRLRETGIIGSLRWWYEELNEEYRKSLPHHVVTGKVEVRG